MEEFEAYVQARSAALARTAYLLTGDVQHAEDLLQDTLSRVAERWEAVVRNGDPEAYVRKVMYHRGRGRVAPSPAARGEHGLGARARGAP